MHSRYNADSEYVLHVGADHKSAEFVGNKHTPSLTHSLTHSALRISTGVHLQAT